MKPCIHCKVLKPLSEFYIHLNHRDSTLEDTK